MRIAALQSTGQTLVASVLALGLAACGGDGGTPREANLEIDGPAAYDTDADTALLTGTSFVPAGSSCPDSDECLRPVYGQLGSYSLRWRNALTGESGTSQATWLCSCDNPRETSFIITVPLAVGGNAVSVTMSDSERTAEDDVVITRR